MIEVETLKLRDIYGYDGDYIVSSTGNVYTTRNGKKRNNTMTIQIISAIALSVMAAVTLIGYVKECKRVNKAKKKAEFASKIERKLELAKRDNFEILRQLLEEGVIPDETISQIVADNNKEIEQMIEQYKRM